MFWVIQEDLYVENRRDDLISTLERFLIPYELVTLRGNDLNPNVNHNGPIITNGSIKLSKIANERGWNPGSMFNENFSYEVWSPIFRNYLLNRDAIFTTIEDFDSPWDTFFVRPINDDKSFNGKITTKDDFAVLKASIKPTLKILIAPLKTIGQEHRHYIVKGKVVSSSRYKLSGKVSYESYVDSYIVDFAQRMANIWLPSDAFVLDTYITDNEVGIVELGCLCHAGLYASDVQKIVMALEELE